MSLLDETTSWKYTGWIPVVSGNMSFSEIGKTKDCRNFFVHNRTEVNSRRQTIILFGRKSLNDGWFYPWIRRRFEKVETEFYFLLALRSTNEVRERGSLVGFVALAVDPNLLRHIKEELIANGGDTLSLPQSIIDASRVYGADVKIFRSGRCDFAFPAK